MKLLLQRIIKKIFPNRYTSYLYWTVFLLIAIPLMGLSYWSGDISYKLLLKDREYPLFNKVNYLDENLKGTFNDIIKASNAQNLSREEKIRVLNNRLQPIINGIAVTNSRIVVGYYDRGLNSVVAVGPVPSKDFLVKAPDDYPFMKSYKTGKMEKVMCNNSIVWPGEPIYTVTKPIVRDGQIIGHTWAGIKVEDVLQTANQIRLTMIVLTLLIITIVHLGLRLMINKTRKSLVEFVETVKDIENVDQFSNDFFPELAPLLEEIKELNQHRKTVLEQEKLAVIGQMAAGMAHEIRNPLTSVKGLVQVIHNRLGINNEDVNELFRIVDEEVDRANEIIREFLAFAKPKPPELQLISANYLVDEISILIDSQCLMNNIKIKKELEPKLPLCPMDADQMKQVLLNMVHNAIEAMENSADKKLILKTQYNPGNNSVVISVRDSGQGISPENLKTIGTPFFTTKDKGTGLGLSVTYKIIESHGGTVDFESILGQGTTFTISCPVSRTSD